MARNKYFYGSGAQPRVIPQPNLDTEEEQDEEVGRLYLPDGSQHVVRQEAVRMPFGFC